METKPQFEQLSENKLLIHAPAKINLSLLIGPKRSDNYHEVHTVMAKINLYDNIILEKTPLPKIKLICNGPYEAPQTPENLVYKAAALLGITKNLKITLTKNIPAAAGLAGGSSDAAATLMGLNRLFQLNLNDDALRTYAAKLGSDIAFFLGGPLAICTSRGEKIENISTKYDFNALLLLPDVKSSTKEVYANFLPDSDQFEAKKAEIITYIDKNRIDLITKMCANMLETSCFKLNPELADLKNDVESFINGSVCLSGSGSAIYVVPEDNEIIQLNKQKRLLQRNLNTKVIIVSNNRW